MLLNYENFKVKMLYEFNKEYPKSYLKKDELIINYFNLEAKILLKMPFEEYLEKGDFYICFNSLKNNIKREFRKNNYNVDYNKVYPFIRNKDFGKEGSANFVREDLFLDLDIMYAVDGGDTYRYVLKNDNYDLEKLRESAMNNLSKNFTGITKIDKDFDVYAIPIITDYSSSYYLLNNVKKQIERKIGQKYLFAIPCATTLLVSKFHPQYIEVLKMLMNVHKDSEKVSEHIYKYRNGVIEYAEKNNFLRVIK